MSMTLRQDPVGLYLHIPFCERQCHFCAFFTRGYREEHAATFVDDLLAEIRLYAQAERLRERSVQTIYFGGGTPTTLSADQLVKILETCREEFRVEVSAEITIEANPATMDQVLLEVLRQAGFNRLSLGAQSFDDRELKAIGSPHDTGELVRGIRTARDAGFANLNLDMIYGLPGQAVESLKRNLRAAVEQEPKHLSVYGFTLEAGTRFALEAKLGRLVLISEDVMAEMYGLVCQALHAAGFLQYEVSNFARPGYECGHNLGYWSDREWLGCGPSAHSYLDGERFCNVDSLEKYHRALDVGTLPIAEREPWDQDLRLREAMAFGVRTVAGVGLKALEHRYGISPLTRFESGIQHLANCGWLECDGQVLRPTYAGLALADELAVVFL